MQFNQDGSCFVFGTSQGFKIYNCSPLSCCYQLQNQTPISHAEMLFSTSLVAIAKHGETDSPRKLAILNTKSGAEEIICELTFPLAIRKIKLNRERVIVTTDTQIFVYDIRSMKLVHTFDIKLAIQQQESLLDISSAPHTSILAFAKAKSDTSNGMPSPDSLTPEIESQNKSGMVSIIDLSRMKGICAVEAHKNGIAALKLNADGSLLATASSKGTLIRVFSIPTGTLLHKFRRGARPATIHSLWFSLNSEFLAVSSSSKTVHIYKLTTPIDMGDPYLIRQRKWINNGEVEFAHCKLPKSSELTKVAIQPLTNRVFVLTTSNFYEFQMNVNRGGECTLEAVYDL